MTTEQAKRIRDRIYDLLAEYGALLNRWPQEKQNEFYQLSRQLRIAENGVQK